MGKRKFDLDFIGIGAEKAGTTWIADCLREHPEVHIPKTKEIFFFNDYDPHFLSIKNYRYKRGIKWYARQFNGGGKKVGEISPTYLYGDVTAKRIKRNFPNTKIIVVLREPISRAFSQYIHDRRLGVIKDITFDEAVRMYRNYLEKGYYFRHLSKYLEVFPRHQILVLFHDDLLDKPKRSVKETYKFLELKNVGYMPKSLSRKKNIAGRARYPFVNYIMMQLDYMLREKRMNFVLKAIDSTGLRRLAIYVRDRNSTSLDKYPKMKVETRKYLAEAYEKENEKLEKLLKRNLKSWKR